MILCSINFSFVFNPVFSLFLILKKSSKNPVIKKPKIVSNKRNNFSEPKFIVIIKRKIKKGIIIKIPPIVGVSLFLLWLEGPSVLIFWSKLNFLIISVPIFVDNKEIKKNNVKTPKKIKLLKGMMLLLKQK